MDEDRLRHHLDESDESLVLSACGAPFMLEAFLGQGEESFSLQIKGEVDVFFLQVFTVPSRVNLTKG